MKKTASVPFHSFILMDEPVARSAHKLRHGPVNYEIFRRVDSLQLHAPFDQKEKDLAEKRSKSHDTGRKEEKLATRLRQFLNVLVGVSVGLAAAAVRLGCQRLCGWRQEVLLNLLAGKGSWNLQFGEARGIVFFCDLFLIVLHLGLGFRPGPSLQVLLIAMAMTAAFAALATVAVVLVPASTGSGIPGGTETSTTIFEWRQLRRFLFFF